MKVTVLLLLCVHVLCISAGKNRGPPEPELTSLACNDPQAEAAADLSLRQLNAHRKSGFVFGLKRITNVQEQFDEENGSVLYLTLDVLETDCHVLSRKLWKDCEPKLNYQAVFGECKVTFQLSKPKRIAHLHNYDCVMAPAAQDGPGGCGGCLFSQPLNDTSMVEVAQKSLVKYNAESNNNKHFLIGNITRASSQVVAGTAYHVEYTIHESTCNKSTDDLSQCEPLDCEFAHTGYCKTFAVAHWSAPDDKQVKRVSCDIFEPEAAVVEEQNHQAGHEESKPDSGKKDHSHGKGKGKKNGHKHGHGRGHGRGHGHDHKHPHKHDHDHSASHEHTHEHDHQHLHEHEHHHTPSQGKQPEAPKTTGAVTYLTGDETATASEDKKGKGGKPPRRGFLLGKGNPHKSFIKSFPEKASTSDQCPGQPKTLPVTEVPLIEAPQDPTKLPK